MKNVVIKGLIMAVTYTIGMIIAKSFGGNTAEAMAVGYLMYLTSAELAKE